MKRKPINIVNSAFLVLFLSLFVFSLWRTVMLSDYIPYLPLGIASLLSTFMFTSLLLSGNQQRYAVMWTLVALIDSGLLILFYFFPSLLEELYPLQLWLALTVIIASIQGLLDRKRKPFHLTMRYMNFGLVLLLIPIFFLRLSATWIWTAISIFTLLVMIANVVLFSLPGRRTH